MFTIGFLILIIFLIVIAATKFKVHPFLILLSASILMGLLGGLDAGSVISKITDGFGDTLKSIGIVIACGTVIGTFLELSGGAKAMASFILKVVGQRNAPFAMSITGFIVSIPVFCDSGFVVLSPLNKAISRRTGISLTILAVSLATGLYTTHVFVPPTPGPLAAAATIGADIGLVLILGLIVSIPTAGAGLLWALFFCKRYLVQPGDCRESTERIEQYPRTGLSFCPILVPILLIALKSFIEYPSAPLGKGIVYHFLGFLGHPVIALLIGVCISFCLLNTNSSANHLDWVTLGLKNAGAIILITGAGGAFGSILRATNIGDTIGHVLSQWNIGILLPFLIAAMLKIAQGSSTVAIITTSALISPLLSSMGLSMPLAKALVVLSIGAGSMTVSHVNDSYFWVVSQFSGMDMATALRCHSLATFVQGLAGITTIFIMALFFI